MRAGGLFRLIHHNRASCAERIGYPFGVEHCVVEGFAWNGQSFASLSQIAKAMTGTNWNGHRFFGLRQGKVDAAGHGSGRRKGEASAGARTEHGITRKPAPMKNLTTKRGLRCAIYTRVSTDQGLEQDFNSLDAQREASEAYING